MCYNSLRRHPLAKAPLNKPCDWVHTTGVALTGVALERLKPTKMSATPAMAVALTGVALERLKQARDGGAADWRHKLH